MNAIRLNWKAANTELDFSHYQIIRDQQLLPDSIYGDSHIDDDPALGHDLHGYVVVAVDTDGIAPLAHPLEAVQRLRDDEVTETDQHERLQSLAPEVSDGLYLVPRVIE